jgi:hypothetical protein
MPEVEESKIEILCRNQSSNAYIVQASQFSLHNRNTKFFCATVVEIYDPAAQNISCLQKEEKAAL